MENKHLRGSDPKVDVYAHRGSTVLAPENTGEAFELAIGYGADVLEIDVRLSRDGHVIVIHDDSVQRTCNGHGQVAQLSLSALKKLDAAYHFTDQQNRPWRDQGVQLMTLSELFERFPDTRINIDIKDNSQEAAIAVARVLDEYGRFADVAVGSFHGQALMHFRNAAPEVPTAASQSEVARLYFNRQSRKPVPYTYLQIPTQYFGLPLATREFIAHAQQRHINVVYWTINTAQSMQTLLERGVNGIVTDRVDLACQLLGKNSNDPGAL